MEKMPQKQKEVTLETVQERISGAEKAINEEIRKNPEYTWPNAALKYLETLRDALEEVIEHELLDEEHAQNAREKANMFLAELRGVASRYSQLEDEVPEEDKQKLLTRFQILK